MKENWKEKIQYHILPGKPQLGYPHSELYEKAYQFWYDYWLNTCNETSLDTNIIESDNFYRHEFINILTFEGEVIAMINCTPLDFGSQSSFHHSYIKEYFTKEFVLELRKKKLFHMLTMENIVAHKDWRSKQLGMSLGGVMLSLALEVAKDYGYDGGFGAARADAPTAKLSYEIGAMPIITGLMFHDKPTDLVAWGRNNINPHPHAESNKLVKKLWSTRIDTIDNQGPISKTKAA